MRAMVRKKVQLDLGCGNNRKDGYLGIDCYPGQGIDYVVDLEKNPLPFKDSSVDRIYASHFLEHVHNLFWVMEEAWRVLKPDGKFQIIVPHYRSRIAYQDPTHVRFFYGSYLQKLLWRELPGFTLRQPT